MDASATATNRLLIRRFQAQYLVSREHPAPERIKARLDDAVVHGLSETLSTILSSWFAAGSDGGIWLINNLELKVDVNASWEPEQLTRMWASQIARSLATTVQGGSDGENVMRFPDRAAYLARFLVDVAEGYAWSKWYYEAFEGLKVLPVSATLRTAICEQPAAGREALHQLTADELKRVLRALTAHDAHRILDSFTDDATAGEEFRCFQAAWSAWDAVEGAGGEWRNGLRLYLATNGGRGDVGGLPLRAAVLALLRLARCLVGGSPSEGAKLLAALTNADRTALYIAAGATNAEVLAPLLRCPSEWVHEVGQALVRGTGPPVDDIDVSPGLRYTHFGGLFLLLPLLDELPLEEATCSWLDADEVCAAAIVRFLLLIKCCGQPRAQRVFYDPLIRDLLGIPPSFSPEVLAHWQKGASASQLQAFVKALGDWHSERGAVQGETLILSLIGSVAVLIDGTRGIWLLVERSSKRRPERLIESLRSWIAGSAREGAVLLSDPLFVEGLRSAFPDRKIVSLLDDAARTMASENQQLAEILARLDKLPDDLCHLSLPKSLGLAGSFDRALSVAAQGLMRVFAWRLPGFAGSNLPYLYTNFLDFSGSLEEDLTRRVIRLGRPPLHLILNMTGMARATYQLSWLDERPFALFPEG